jgi:hypothetical protein
LSLLKNGARGLYRVPLAKAGKCSLSEVTTSGADPEAINTICFLMYSDQGVTCSSNVTPPSCSLKALRVSSAEALPAEVAQSARESPLGPPTGFGGAVRSPAVTFSPGPVRAVQGPAAAGRSK